MQDTCSICRSFEFSGNGEIDPWFAGYVSVPNHRSVSPESLFHLLASTTLDHRQSLEVLLQFTRGELWEKLQGDSNKSLSERLLQTPSFPLLQLSSLFFINKETLLVSQSKDWFLFQNKTEHNQQIESKLPWLIGIEVHKEKRSRKKTIIQSPKRAKDPQPEKENPLTGKLSRSNDRRYYTTKRDGNRRLKSPATRTVVLFKRIWWEKFGLLKVGRITRHFSQSKHTAANNPNEKPNHRKFLN